MSDWGRDLCGLFAGAEEEVAVVAPFIKVRAIERLLGACSDAVEVTVIGRFRPDDIVAGVCDLEAAELLLSRPRVTLYTHPLLHAKLYRADNACLVGSANVTLRGLGWLPLSNEELLVETERTPFLVELEHRLTVDGEVMTWPRLRDLHARIRDLPKQAPEEPAMDEPPSDALWMPTCRTPRYLFDVYAGTNEWRLLESAREAATRDLRAMGPLPPNLDRPAFEAAVRAALRQHQVVKWLVEQQEAVESDIVAGQIDPLASKSETTLSPELLWEIFQEWLLYFFPSEFRLVPAETKLSYGHRV